MPDAFMRRSPSAARDALHGRLGSPQGLSSRVPAYRLVSALGSPSTAAAAAIAGFGGGSDTRSLGFSSMQCFECPPSGLSDSDAADSLPARLINLAPCCCKSGANEAR